VAPRFPKITTEATIDRGRQRIGTQIRDKAVELPLHLTSILRLSSRSARDPPGSSQPPTCLANDPNLLSPPFWRPPGPAKTRWPLLGIARNCSRSRASMKAHSTATIGFSRESTIRGVAPASGYAGWRRTIARRSTGRNWWGRHKAPPAKAVSTIRGRAVCRVQTAKFARRARSWAGRTTRMCLNGGKWNRGLPEVPRLPRIRDRETGPEVAWHTSWSSKTNISWRT